MTSSAGGLRISNGLSFHSKYRDALRNWDDQDDLLTIPAAITSNSEDDDMELSIKVYKFHLILMAALDDALTEHESTNGGNSD